MLGEESEDLENIGEAIVWRESENSTDSKGSASKDTGESVCVCVGVGGFDFDSSGGKWVFGETPGFRLRVFKFECKFGANARAY